MGIVCIEAEDRSLYGVTVVYLVSITEFLYYIIEQIILVESLMVSGQRMLEIEKFEKELSFRTAYDRDVGLA
jgi:hypothetical protein